MRYAVSHTFAFGPGGALMQERKLYRGKHGLRVRIYSKPKRPPDLYYNLFCFCWGPVFGSRCSRPWAPKSRKDFIPRSRHPWSY